MALHKIIVMLFLFAVLLIFATCSDNSTGSESQKTYKITFNSIRDGNGEIYTMNADGTNQTRLTTDDNFDKFPDWLHNGQKIAFSSNSSS